MSADFKELGIQKGEWYILDVDDYGNLVLRPEALPRPHQDRGYGFLRVREIGPASITFDKGSETT